MLLRSALALMAAAGVLAAQPASAQSMTPGSAPPVPDMSSRIPPPYQPPPPAPEVNGPLPNRPNNLQHGPQAFTPPRLNTFSDRVERCVHQGSAGGLGGGELQAYVRQCANDN
jgi:hypothetical protein